MKTEVIKMNETEAIEVNQTAEEKPAKKIKILGRVITVEKAEKPAHTDDQPKPKKHIGKKIAAAAIVAVVVGGVVLKAITNHGKTVEVDDPEQEYLPETDYSVSDDENNQEPVYTEENPENNEGINE